MQCKKKLRDKVPGISKRFGYSLYFRLTTIPSLPLHCRTTNSLALSEGWTNANSQSRGWSWQILRAWRWEFFLNGAHVIQLWLPFQIQKQIIREIASFCAYLLWYEEGSFRQWTDRGKTNFLWDSEQKTRACISVTSLRHLKSELAFPQEK